MGNKYDWSGENYNDFNRQDSHAETHTKLEYCESEYQRLKESTSLLELALWRARTSHFCNTSLFMWVPVAAFHETIHSQPIAL
jgi:hypothetical protein